MRDLIKEEQLETELVLDAIERSEPRPVNIDLATSGPSVSSLFTTDEIRNAYGLPPLFSEEQSS